MTHFRMLEKTRAETEKLLYTINMSKIFLKVVG